MLVLDCNHLLVDESALTGESNPVAKVKVDDEMRKEMYDETKHKQYTLYAGTTILENGENDEDMAVVLATGSFTKKGQLLCDILSYKRHKFQFDDEITPVLLILGVEAIALVIMVYKFLGDQYVISWFYATFVLATIFPPLLPTVFVVSVGISAKRLGLKRIACTYPEGILVAGKVNVCCFDKTGTLTEAGMNATGVDCNGNEELKNLAFLGMGVCHNLKVMGTGEIIGNEVDKASFEFSGSKIDTREGKDFEIIHQGKRYIIVKQNLFDNMTVTQSVIVETEDGKNLVFVKGSPEAIRSICKPKSIPVSFDETFRSGSKSGLYQLGIAYKELKMEKELENDDSPDLKNEVEICPVKVSMLPRKDIESSLTFCGFINFENILKKESVSVMQDLHEGNVLVTMITGDNVLTGVRIAKECGICQAETTILAQLGINNRIEWVNVDADEIVSKPLDMTRTFDLAITGDAWSSLVSRDPEYAKLIVKYIRVFGRCNPECKVSVVTTLVQLGYVTLMCGDGQNDCGALKAAHIGVALSTADASIVAPFTSLDLTVASVSEILREGRCALSSALKVYSYFMLYGQLCSMLQTMNAYFVTTFNGWAWIFLDGIWPISMAFTLPLAAAAKKLSSCRPTASLFGPRTLSSICGLLGWNLVYLILAIFLLFQQDWFQCREWAGTDASGAGEIQDNYETATLFIVGGYQFVSTAMALSFGYTFRAPWYTNYWFVGFFIAFTVMQFVMTLYPSSFSCIWRVNCSNEVSLVCDFNIVFKS
jgi:predicted P-type ATPase